MIETTTVRSSTNYDNMLRSAWDAARRGDGRPSHVAIYVWEAAGRVLATHEPPNEYADYVSRMGEAHAVEDYRHALAILARGPLPVESMMRRNIISPNDADRRIRAILANDEYTIVIHDDCPSDCADDLDGLTTTKTITLTYANGDQTYISHRTYTWGRGDSWDYCGHQIECSRSEMAAGGGDVDIQRIVLTTDGEPPEEIAAIAITAYGERWRSRLVNALMTAARDQ